MNTKKVKFHIIDIVTIMLAIMLLTFGIIVIPSLYENDEKLFSGSSRKTKISSWEPKGYKYLNDFNNYFSKDIAWLPATTGAGRQVNLLVSVPLYLKQGSADVIDFLKTEKIHPPVENSWFVDNDLDWKLDIILDQDTDKDGFSNLEEYQAQTNPNSYDSFPLLITKVELVAVNSLPWQLKFSSYAAGKAWFNYMDAEGNTLNKTKTGIAPGGIFFSKGEMNTQRFKLLEIEEGVEVETRPGRFRTTQMATIEDLSSFAKGAIYKVPRTLPKTPKLLEQYQFEDLTAEIRLNALDQANISLIVKVNEEFSLPFGNTTAATTYKVQALMFNSDLNAYELEIGWLESGEQKVRKITL